MYSLMVVDDEPIILNGISDAVKVSGLPLKTIQTAASAQEALLQLEKSPCDIMLSDIRMPDMDGLKMVSQAKEIWPQMRVIFLTGYQDFEYARAALRLNSDDFLIKPCADSILVDAIAKVISSLDKEWLQRFEMQWRETNAPKEEWAPEQPVRMIFMSYTADEERVEQEELHKGLSGMLIKMLNPYCRALRIKKKTNTTFLTVQPSIEAKHWENVAMKILEEIQSFFLEQLDSGMAIGLSREVSFEDSKKMLEQWLQQYGRQEQYGSLVLMQEEAKENRIESINYVVRAIHDYVRDNPQKDLSLGALAWRFHMNPSYLSRIFHQETGLPLSEYILQVRLDAARKLLLQTHMKIYEIAEKTGFGTPGYFTKVFHKAENISPKNYRIDKGWTDEK